MLSQVMGGSRKGWRANMIDMQTEKKSMAVLSGTAQLVQVGGESAHTRSEIQDVGGQWKMAAVSAPLGMGLSSAKGAVPFI
jgi:hypothetical protein